MPIGNSPFFKGLLGVRCHRYTFVLPMLPSRYTDGTWKGVTADL